MNGDYRPEKDVEQEVWLSAIQQMALTLRGGRYLTGFHAFTTLESALAWSKRPGAVVVPVAMRNIRLEGLHAPEGQHGDEPILRCWVADEMYVTREIVKSACERGSRSWLTGKQDRHGSFQPVSCVVETSTHCGSRPSRLAPLDLPRDQRWDRASVWKNSSGDT